MSCIYMDKKEKYSCFDISQYVKINVPEKAFEEAFWIAVRLIADMRRLAYEHYSKDGWLAVSDGQVGPQHSYDPRDFRYGPKCAAYLYGTDPSFSLEMGKRIFHDEIDINDGHIQWDSHHQTAIHLAQTAKHFSDYIVYAEQDEFVKDNWVQLLKMIKWGLTTYDRNNDGLIEHGLNVPDHFWGLLVGEPLNFPYVKDGCNDDVVVVATMEVYELLYLMSALSVQMDLPETDWLKEKTLNMHNSIENLAYDSDAGYYYLAYRASEQKWYHSMLGINENSRELDVTPYYAAILSGNHSRAVKVANYARQVLLDYDIFPMPLHFPGYFWGGGNYSCPQHFVPGGCWEESYYNCTRAFSQCGMLDAIYEAIKRRSMAYVRDKDCMEWYTQKGTTVGCRDRYGISAGAHVSAVIEGLFGITPTRFGFNEVNIYPNIPSKWTDLPVAISVALPRNGFLKYTYLYDTKAQLINITFETNKRRYGHFRIFVPRTIECVKWNTKTTQFNSAQQIGRGAFVYINKNFERDCLQIKVGN